MKVLAVFLAVVATVAAQKFSYFANGKPIAPINNNQQYAGCNSQTLVHARWGTSEYHFSWCADGGRTYDGQTANAYCARLGQGWRGISIESQPENAFVTQTILANNLQYIWTSGQRSSYDFVWGSGSPFVGFGWSHTGLTGQRQPDNRENNAENCLAVMNNFYQDGVVWHDIACHHTKPIICERNY